MNRNQCFSYKSQTKRKDFEFEILSFYSTLSEPKMSSVTPLKQVLIRVKRRADEEKSVPNKRCKFVATCDSPKDDHIYQLLAKTKPLPQTQDYDSFQIKDFDDWNHQKTNEKIKDSQSSIG